MSVSTPTPTQLMLQDLINLHQLLGVCADRDHQSPSWLQLLYERLRQCWRRRPDMYRIIWTSRSIALPPVPFNDFHVSRILQRTCFLSSKFSCRIVLITAHQQVALPVLLDIVYRLFHQLRDMFDSDRLRSNSQWSLQTILPRPGEPERAGQF